MGGSGVRTQGQRILGEATNTHPEGGGHTWRCSTWRCNTEGPGFQQEEVGACAGGMSPSVDQD